MVQRTGIEARQITLLTPRGRDKGQREGEPNHLNHLVIEKNGEYCAFWA